MAAKKKLKDDGKLIMIEPVVDQGKVEGYHGEKGQRLMIRTLDSYKKLLNDAGYKLVNEKHHAKQELLSHDLHSFVWMKREYN